MARYLVPIVLVAFSLLMAAPAVAEEYKVDPAHTSVYFKIRHLGISDVYGRFNKPEGTYTTGESPSFNLSLQADSIDTGVERRDAHLRSADFFNVEKFPTITLKSTEVTETEEGYELTGDLTLHGVTKPVTFPLVKIGETTDQQGNHRTGFATQFKIKRSDYGMTNMLGPVGDEVTLMISFEGIRQGQESS